jgi:peptide-methionine (S)-S-oxide reductase
MNPRKKLVHVLAAALLALQPALNADETEPVMPKDDAKSSATASTTQKATFGMGCFWCGEAIFQRLDGVVDVQSGYTGGQVDNPTYKQVCSGKSGHAEVIQITYDPAKIKFSTLLDTYWLAHDPTQLNRQGNDVGTQYRSAVFYHSDDQKRDAEASKAKLDASKTLKKPVVTEVTKASKFYSAEAYHDDYYNNNKNAPYCRFVIAPKLKKLGIE